MSDDPYVYPGTTTLQNKLDIRSAEALDRVERRFVIQRIRDGVPTGDFDLPHLQAIHRHLFQDVYEWAGQIRSVEISKDGSKFQLQRYIETGMANVHQRIVGAGYLKGLSPADFAAKAGQIIGDVNHVHPFREGNGRTQLQYLKQLTDQAGHVLALKKLDREAWHQASREANDGRYDAMARCIEGALIERSRSRSARTIRDRSRPRDDGDRGL